MTMKTKAKTIAAAICVGSLSVFNIGFADDDKHEHKDKGHKHEDADHEHEHGKESGPNGGRLITSVEPHAEFLVTKDRKVQITFVGHDDKVVPASAQVSAPEDEVGVNDIDHTTDPVEEGEAEDSSVQETSDPVADLIQRREFVEQVAAAMVTNGNAADSLLGDLSDKLQDHIEDDPDFRRNLITRAMASPSFCGKVVKALAKAMD